MLKNVKNSLSKVFSNRKYIVVLVVTIIFIATALYTYKHYVMPRLNPTYVANKEFTSSNGTGNETDTADLYFFYTEWCPHCKAAKPIWAKLKEEVGDGKIKGVQVNFIEIDCDKNTEIADKFKVEGYPTIKLVSGNQIIEYDAKPDKDTLLQFLNTSL
jgi:thiol-disulfide isomerase/thioredoxin